MYKKTNQDEIHNHILHQDYVHLQKLKTQLFVLLRKLQQLPNYKAISMHIISYILDIQFTHGHCYIIQFVTMLIRLLLGLLLFGIKRKLHNSYVTTIQQLYNGN